MGFRWIGAAGVLAFLLAGAPVAAQTSAPGEGAAPGQGAVENPLKPSRRTRKSAASDTAEPAAKSRREPSMGQMAARERQKKCGAEWREAKAAGKTAGMKWPQYWSKCNARLKGNQA